MSARDYFTLMQLRQLFEIEITRANSSLIDTQIAAALAMSRDLVPGAENIAPAWLQIDAMQIQFGLVKLPKPWYRRLLNRFRLFRRWTPNTFRFAAAGDEGIAINFVCDLRCHNGSQFSSDISEDDDATEAP